MLVTKRPDHCLALFLRRTVSAQIHLLTLVIGIVGLIVLLPYAAKQGPLHLWGTLAFGLTSIFVFTVSAFYHFLHDGYQLSPRVTSFMEQLDQSAIYLFIAGTYTPVLLNAIVDPWKTILMISVWCLAIVGIIYTAFRHRLPVWAQSRSVYTLMFALMGWLLVIRIGEAWTRLRPLSLFCLLAGSVAYSIGAMVYVSKRPRLFEGFFGFHELWHLLVTAGFLFHYGMVCSFYVAG